VPLATLTYFSAKTFNLKDKPSVVVAMDKQYRITNTEKTDLPLIFEFFEHSINYQEKHGYPAWRHYDKDVVVKEVENKNQYKILVESAIAMVFSVRYSDNLIWRELDEGDSIYLHRIVVNPVFKGRKLFGVILEWAKDHVKQKGLRSIRMDTWADNPTIINYYKTFGFQFVQNYTTPDSPELPVHNRRLPMTLLEYKLDNN
jgi:GNAT superfamily N-acetyltransferase